MHILIVCEPVGTGENQAEDMFSWAHTERGMNGAVTAQMSETSVKNEALSHTCVCECVAG